MFVALCSDGHIRLSVDEDYDYYRGTADEDYAVYIDDALSSGRVEICIGGQYGSICADEQGGGWDRQAAMVACRQLGYSSYGKSIQ